MIFGSLFGRKKKRAAVPAEEQPIDRIREVSLRRRAGASDVRFELELRNDGYYATVRLDGETADDAVVVRVGEDVADEIAELLNTYDVTRWDGFHESERGVLDGDSFSFSVYYGDGNGIAADGYMSFPDSFDEVAEGLEEIFLRVRESASGE